MFLAGFIAGCVLTTWWWTWLASLYDKPTTKWGEAEPVYGGDKFIGMVRTESVQSTDGLGNTTEYRPHWRRSGP